MDSGVWRATDLPRGGKDSKTTENGYLRRLGKQPFDLPFLPAARDTDMITTGSAAFFC